MNLPLILHFTKQELIDRYTGSMLGASWAFLMPLVNILIFIFVFSEIMGARLESFGAEFSKHGYSIFLITGIVAWTAFGNTLSRTTNIFKEKSGLIGKVNISMAQLPLFILVSEAVVFAISYLFFIGFLLLIEFPLGWSMLFIPLVFLIQQLLAYALGFLLAVLSVFMKDIREFVTIGLQLWFWLTPIVYVVSIIPEGYRTLFTANPMYHLIEAYRALLLYKTTPDLTALGLITLIGLATLAVSIVLFSKLERDIRDFI